MIDLEYFCWREPCGDTEGDGRLLIPHADPDEYEYPIDHIWPTAQEAVDFRDEYITELTAEATDSVHGQTGRDEVAAVKSWVLVKYVGRIIVPPADEIDQALDDLYEELDNLVLDTGPVGPKGIELHTKLEQLAHDSGPLSQAQNDRLLDITRRVLRDVFRIEPNQPTVTPPEENRPS